jgi:hypothetical protein
MDLDGQIMAAASAHCKNALWRCRALGTPEEQKAEQAFLRSWTYLYKLSFEREARRARARG